MTTRPPRRRPRVRSLRRRLFVLIVAPLVAVAVISSVVLHWMARNMSRALYDDTLKVVAHAVAREAVMSSGNVMPDLLLRSLIGAIGDPIFYQVHAADGLFVVGHSDAPPLPEGVEVRPGAPVFFDAVYHGLPVRAVVLREYISDPQLDSWTTVRVWQTVTRRQELSLIMLAQSAGVLALLVVSAAGLVWFGIDRGLAPLTNLREAVAIRTTNDLRPIRRAVPLEAAPLVATINNLFTRLSDELQRRNVFVSNAAHQLRNPVAAIQAQAESALSARSDEDRIQRLQDLALAARRLSRMSQQLLRLDAATEGPADPAETPVVEFGQLVADVARRHVPGALKASVEVALDAHGAPLPVRANSVLLEEAVDNLIDNALRYGCPPGTELSLRLTSEAGAAVLRVADQGPGIPAEMSEKVFERFVRLSAEDDGGCGLGLPIVREIARRAGGQVGIEHSTGGCVVALSLPLASAPEARLTAA